MTEYRTNPNVDRRTVVKGAAWAVPVIAAATAVPLASASGVPADPTDVAISVFGQTGQADRGFETHLIDKNFQPVPFPSGTSMSIRVTSVNGGAVDGITTTGATLVATHINGTVTTYTYIVPEGGTTVSFRGNVTGTITAVVTYAGSFGTISSSAISITGA